MGGCSRVRHTDERDIVQPVVAIVMGSSSDHEVMVGAATILERFKVDYELHVVSAHRTPEAMIAFGLGARERRVKVIIAGAGGAAHLPGMLAATTTLPVIGCPWPWRDSTASIRSSRSSRCPAACRWRRWRSTGRPTPVCWRFASSDRRRRTHRRPRNLPTRARRRGRRPGPRTSQELELLTLRRDGFRDEFRHFDIVCWDNRGGTRGCNEASIEHFPGQEQCGP